MMQDSSNAQGSLRIQCWPRLPKPVLLNLVIGPSGLRHHSTIDHDSVNVAASSECGHIGVCLFDVNEFML